MSRGTLTRRSAAVLAIWVGIVQLGGLAVAAGARRGDVHEVTSGAPAPAEQPAVPPPTTLPPAPPTTSTTVPAPPTTVAPTPVVPTPAPVVPAAVMPPPTTPAPAPPPTSPPSTAPPPTTSSPQAPTGGLLQQVLSPYQTSVPAVWRNAITVSFEVIAGTASYAWPSGRIQISTTHLLGGLPQLRTALAHEFGHLIAYRYGSQSRAGAPPAGWPYAGSQPNEAWADCVAQVFTGIADASHGLPLCPAATLTWTASWLAAGPSGHPRTDGGG